LNTILLSLIILIFSIKGGFIYDTGLNQSAQIVADNLANGAESAHTGQPHAELIGRTTGDYELIIDGFLKSPSHWYRHIM